MKKIVLFIFFFFITFINVSAEEEYLKNILVDGVSIEGFASDKTEYTLNVEAAKESIKITFDYDTSLYTGRGNYGDISLKPGENMVSFTLTSIENANNTLTYKINITREDNRSRENSLASLTIGTTNVILTDKTDYEVTVSSTLTKVEVKAVLKDTKASFVSGFGERVGTTAITLNKERTPFQIKVQAENGDIKEYNITVVKKDYRSNDATLKSLTISDLEFEFKPATYEYNLTVEDDIEKVTIKALTNNDKASVEYEEEQTLVTGNNSIVIKVQAEDGTTREYKLNISRKEAVPLVSMIEIEGIDFEFSNDTYNYTIETELTELDFKVTLTSETATSEILNNENLTNNSVVNIEVKDGEKTVTYSFTIKKEEEDLIEENDQPDSNEQNSSLKEFLDKYEMYLGLGTFGLGLLLLIIAILTRPKNSQIM